MRYKNLITIAIILLFAACKEIRKEDLQGDWYVSYDKGEPEIEQLIFSEEKVEWIDDYSFKHSGTYQIENGALSIKRTKDSFEFRTKIESLIADTLVIFDSLVYYRNTPFTDFNYDEYDLIGIPTNLFFSGDSRNFQVRHYYKSKDNDLIIRQGSNIGSLENFPLFLHGNGHHRKKEIIIFIGKGITLKNLKELYMEIALTGHYRAGLVTKKEGIARYHAFADRIEIWREELEQYAAKSNALLPPPPLTENKDDHWDKDKGAEEIKINQIEDIEMLDELVKGKYIFSVNQEMSIEDYIKVKSKYKELRSQKYQVITEIEQR